MGLLDRLKGGGTTLSVDVEPDEITPGATVVLRFTIDGDLDDKCRAIRAGVTCVGTYIDEERGRDANGHPIMREVGHEVTLHDDQRQLPLQSGPGQEEFTLPADAAPASADAVEWTAWVSIEREHGTDRIERVPVNVRAAPSSPGIVPDVTDNGLTLHGVPDRVRAGESVTGTLTVNVTEDLKVSGVIVRLNRRRTYVAQPVADWDPDHLLIDVVTARGVPYVAHLFQGVTQSDVFGKTTFEAGAPQSATFSVTVPGDAGPSTAYANAQVDWTLEAVLNRRLHGDLSASVPIVVR